MLKRRENDRFHVVSTSNPPGVFVVLDLRLQGSNEVIACNIFISFAVFPGWY